jgi:hypothetical protein
LIGLVFGLAGALRGTLLIAQGTDPYTDLLSLIGTIQDEGAKYPQQPLNDFRTAHGTSERLCVEAGEDVRSGEIVIGGVPPAPLQFLYDGPAAIALRRKVWLSPLHLPVRDRSGWPEPMTLQVRAIRIDAAAPPETHLVSAIVRTNGQFRFWPVEHLPVSGRWLLVVTGGPNWGCFFYGSPAPALGSPRKRPSPSH